MTVRTLLLPAAVAAALAAAPATAAADTLLHPTPAGTQNLTANGGYLAWAEPNQPAGSGWRIVVREPSGAVVTPPIPVFEDPPVMTIGSDRAAAGRNLLLTYSRAGDVYTYDLRQGGAERRVRRVSTAADERLPTVSYGTFHFVRASGSRPGIYQWSPRSGLRRIARDLPRELASNGTRVAYPKGNRIVVRRASGRGTPFVLRTTGRPRSLLLSRYRVSWLVGDEAFKSGRFGGSGSEVPANASERGARLIPGAVSIAFGRGDRVTLALDAEGVKQLVPTPFGSTG